jgi:hypothetical protein
MPSFQETHCLTVLYAGASAAIGLVLRTDDPAKARAALYHARNMLNDPELASLTIRVSPDDSEHELWLLSNRNAVSVDLI